MTMYIAGMSGRWRSFTFFCSHSGSSAGRKNTVCSLKESATPKQSMLRQGLSESAR